MSVWTSNILMSILFSVVMSVLLLFHDAITFEKEVLISKVFFFLVKSISINTGRFHCANRNNSLRITCKNILVSLLQHKMALDNYKVEKKKFDADVSSNSDT